MYDDLEKAELQLIRSSLELSDRGTENQLIDRIVNFRRYADTSKQGSSAKATGQKTESEFKPVGKPKSKVAAAGDVQAGTQQHQSKSTAKAQQSKAKGKAATQQLNSQTTTGKAATKQSTAKGKADAQHDKENAAAEIPQVKSKVKAAAPQHNKAKPEMQQVKELAEGTADKQQAKVDVKTAVQKAKKPASADAELIQAKVKTEVLQVG